MITRRHIALAALVGLLPAATMGCGDEPADRAAGAADALIGDACGDAAVPALDPIATTELERDIVGKLAGAAEIDPGVRLGDRASPDNRRAARAYLGRTFHALGLAAQEHAYGTGTNVFAELPSTTPSATWLVVGAHFDSVARSPGANDNATGVALVLAVARHLAGLGCRSKNVAFVLFDQEEVGLVGSRAYAQKLQRDQRQVSAVHTVDQMGWDRNDDRMIELERPDTGLAEQYRAAVTALGLAIPIRITNTGSTDHAAFRPAFPAIGVTEGYRSGDTSPDYHRPTDTFDKVDFPYLLSTTTLVGRVLSDQLR